jgi:hypothetical protein
MKNTLSTTTASTISESPYLGRRLTALFVTFILTIQTLPAFAGVYYTPTTSIRRGR